MHPTISHELAQARLADLRDQAQLDAGQPTTAAHAPLLAQVRLLAERARIPLQPPRGGRHQRAAASAGQSAVRPDWP